MATSLNGLTVGDSLAENIMDSPSREDLSLQCSPMSEDFDDSRYCYTPLHTSILQSETTSCPASPVSPHRHQPPSPAGPSAPNLHAPPGCTLHALAASSHPRLHGSDSSDGVRFPSSPNDVCHTGDLRRVALLRSVQMRAQPNWPTAYEGDERLYLSPERETDYVEDAPAAEVDPSEAKLGEL
ncbi:uncharacterized protein M6B38_275395 [Iris pallida]|uniref:Uncharacterized protein n=1 Tax=Iris pallida TaxID=29817 RepID=A0AAX6I5X4_IRIPA|nr:uncharacterized protein M6B38_275395 [Iris pallida]